MRLIEFADQSPYTLSTENAANFQERLGLVTMTICTRRGCDVAAPTVKQKGQPLLSAIYH